MNMPDVYGTESRIFRTWALFRPAEDLPGHWVAHCLDLDVVTSGMDLSQAIGHIMEASQMTIEEDLKAGLEPHTRRAPQQHWDELKRVVEHGTAVSMGTILSPGASKNWKALALQINLRIESGSQIEGQEFTQTIAEPAELSIS